MRGTSAHRAVINPVERKNAVDNPLHEYADYCVARKLELFCQRVYVNVKKPAIVECR